MSKADLIGFYTILRKEYIRIVRIWSQTLLPPVMNVALYLLIFGAFMGTRIGKVGENSYASFIIPGLILMAVITNSYGNVSTSFFSAKFQKNIEEILVSPIPEWLIVLGFAFGGIIRESSEPAARAREFAAFGRVMDFTRSALSGWSRPARNGRLRGVYTSRPPSSESNLGRPIVSRLLSITFALLPADFFGIATPGSTRFAAPSDSSFVTPFGMSPSYRVPAVCLRDFDIWPLSLLGFDPPPPLPPCDCAFAPASAVTS